MERDLARLRAIFDEVIQAPPASRAPLLAERCGNDIELRRRVEALIAAAEADEPFLSEPTRDRQSLGLPTTVAPGPLSERPGTRIGPYKLLQTIGEGGFGVVFMAEQDQPVRRRVALKIIKLGMDTRQIVARFEQERQALALMDHPNIARVFDAGATGSGRPYFVMEYVIGDPITAFADAHKLSVRQRLDLFAQVCGAVQHAHTKGVIHRDIKPRNVLVSMVDGKPFAKVIDFGIAKATGARLTEKTLFTEHRQLVGTPEYMSPEQAEGSPDIDTRTDVYALGVLLYELLTGATPFDAERLRSAAFAEMQRIIKEEEPPMPSVRLSRSLPTLAATAAARQSEPAKLSLLIKGELDWIVMKSLDKDRARRYETPNQLAADVNRHLAGEPVIAAPPSAAYRLRKFVRKHKAGVVAGSAIAAALVLGIAGTTWQWWRADRLNRDITEQNEFVKDTLFRCIAAEGPLVEFAKSWGPMGEPGKWVRVKGAWSEITGQEIGFAVESFDGTQWHALQGMGLLEAVGGYLINTTEDRKKAYAELEDTNVKLREEVKRARLAEASVLYAHWAERVKGFYRYSVLPPQQAADPERGLSLVKGPGAWDARSIEEFRANELKTALECLQNVASTREELLGPEALDTVKGLWMLEETRCASEDKGSPEMFEELATRLERENVTPDSELATMYARELTRCSDDVDIDCQLRWTTRIARVLPILADSENMRGTGAYFLMLGRGLIEGAPYDATPDVIDRHARWMFTLTRSHLVEHAALRSSWTPWGEDDPILDPAGKDRLAELVQQSLSTSPDDPRILTALAIVQWKSGSLPEALATARQAAELRAKAEIPESPTNVAIAAMVLSAQDRRAEALLELAQLREMMQDTQVAEKPFSRRILRAVEESVDPQQTPDGKLQFAEAPATFLFWTRALEENEPYVPEQAITHVRTAFHVFEALLGTSHRSTIDAALLLSRLGDGPGDNYYRLARAAKQLHATENRPTAQSIALRAENARACTEICAFDEAAAWYRRIGEELPGVVADESDQIWEMFSDRVQGYTGFPSPQACGGGPAKVWLGCLAPFLAGTDSDTVRHNAIKLWTYQLNFYSSSLSSIEPHLFSPQWSSHELPRTLKLIESSGADSALISRSVGMARYRLSRYADALIALMRAAEQRSFGGIPPHPSELAYLAMSQAKLGMREQATATLRELRLLMLQDWMATTAIPCCGLPGMVDRLNLITDPNERRWETMQADRLLAEAEALIEPNSDGVTEPKADPPASP